MLRKLRGMSSADPIVAFSGVAVRRGATDVLRGIDLQIDPGEIIGLFGRNGAGKTTLLEMMATTVRPYEGSAKVLGVDLADEERLDLRGRIGVIGHTPALYQELTLRENLDIACRLTGVGVAGIDDALLVVGLAGAADRRSSECSFGMQRRMEFARELLLEPELLLLDEPHSALDVAAAELVGHLTDAIVQRSGAAVLVSHDRERVEKLATRSVELSGGSLVEGLGRE